MSRVFGPAVANTIALVFQVGIFAVLGLPAYSQGSKALPPTISKEPLDAERLAIYRAVIGTWESRDHESVRLSNQTYSLDVEDCETTGLDLENIDPAVVHRFRKSDLVKLGASGLSLVDQGKQLRKVVGNDPEKTVRAGKPVDKALQNAFAVGLTLLSEIRFDQTHEHAIVAWKFYCGTLCAHGAGWVMEKKDGEWTFGQHGCSIWMARFDPTLPLLPSPSPDPAD